MAMLQTSVYSFVTTKDEGQVFIRGIAGTNKSLTIVTGFFDIGDFMTTNGNRTPEIYANWIKLFGRIKNPVVFYTDSQDFATLFDNVRKDSKHLTKTIIVNRNSLWSFQIMPKIAKVFSTPGYPLQHPNTFIPAYAALTHSKFPALVDAIQQNYFPTDYYTWLDIGYFREIVNRNKTFWLEVPSDFEATKVGVTRVYDCLYKGLTPKYIIQKSFNWIGAGIILGKPEVLLRFAKQYKDAVMRYLNDGLMNTEQPIMYSMYLPEERKAHPLDVDLHLYIPGTKKVLSRNLWFYLGYLMYHET
ncbi:uncharacterized protein LOC132549116 [Ylistrum balloti]|uniref:uncharacterized protein LOC132549116 n=1 Tax=Ylistrum balloti TaxID=509963 RepID=UPI00290580E5|nr:uncharacterized protein LOC132549116 [Ylistrum balloti]